MVGPQVIARFNTRPFTVKEPLFFLFSYHKALHMSELRLYARKREDTKDTLLFEVPKLSIENHRWFR